MAKRKIAGATAIVTGASSGIGREIALELARGGADVVVVARREDRLQEVVAQITSLGRRGEVVCGDITQAATREAALVCALEQLGGLDILVNNAGVGAIGEFETADPDRLRTIFELNFFAPVELIRAALPLLRESQAAGRRPIIADIGSILGHVGIPKLSEYCAAKHALRGFSNSLRAELRHGGIDVLVVSPATVETEIWERMIEQKGETGWRKKRGMTPEYVARKTVAAIKKGRREILPGWSAKFVHLGYSLCPAGVSWLLERGK